jgi:hypothetical protein
MLAFSESSSSFRLRTSKHITGTDRVTRAFLTRVIQPATVYYPVLSVLDSRTEKSDGDIGIKPAFIRSGLHSDWQKFVDLTLDRLEVKQHFGSTFGPQSLRQSRGR